MASPASPTRARRRKYVDAQGLQSAVVATNTIPVKLVTDAAKAPVSRLSSFDIFNCCIERSRNLLKIHRAAHGKKAKPEKYLADAHRAAIVLAISALDAFVRSFVIERVRTILANKTSPLPESLAKRIKSFLKEDGLLEAARKDDLLDRVEKCLRDDFEKRSFQGTRAITEWLEFVGYADIFHTVAVNAQENEDNLRKDLDRFTDRRHCIAHRGDYDLSQNPPRELTVTRKDVEDCVKAVALIASHIQKLGRST